MIVCFVGSNRVRGDGVKAGFDDFALYPLDANSSGRRLMKICGIKRETFLDPELVGRANLCGRFWNWGEARSTVEVLRDTYVHDMSDLPNTLVSLVLLGRLVVQAFGVNLAPFTTRTVNGQVFVSLPHPSGMCREWNEPRNWKRARRLLQSAIPDIPWGEIDGT